MRQTRYNYRMANEGDPLDTLRARLYAPKPVGEVTPDMLSQQETPSAEHWVPPPVRIKPKRKPLPPSLWFLIFAGIFFVVAGTIAALFIIFGTRSVSVNNVKITVQGPTTIASGDTVPLLITIKNSNPVSLNAATITVDLPDGTKNADDTSQALDQYSDT